ncbi:MAG: hypothetical protein ABIX00_10920, partial [Polaromonas sp.]
ATQAQDLTPQPPEDAVWQADATQAQDLTPQPPEDAVWEADAAQAQDLTPQPPEDAAGQADATQAQDLTPQPPEDAVWLAASDHALDQLRGGFDMGSGLVVSFGISRAVYVNDQLASSTSLQVGDITKLNPAQALALNQQMASQTLVVQNGPGNTVEPGAATIPLATYIQNTLYNQTIRNQTEIHATTNGLGIIKSLNLQNTLNDALINAIRSR